MLIKRFFATVLTVGLLAGIMTVTSPESSAAAEEVINKGWVKLDNSNDYAKETTVKAVVDSPLLDQTNIERQKAGLKPLAENSKLDQAAQEKAEDMIKNQYWAHTSPRGVSPWHWFDKVGYNYKHAGENLAKNYSTDQATTDGWMNSKGHRANILNSKYSEAGFGKAKGVIDGEEVTITVALYGQPSL